MTSFRSVPVTVEARRWPNPGGEQPLTAWREREGKQIVAWVKREGGEARYEPSDYDAIPSVHDHGSRIAVRTPTGFDLFMAPGDWIVKGDGPLIDPWSGKQLIIWEFLVVSDLSELRMAHHWEAVDG